ncbi:hypothetical protein HDV01_003096 [Terramyces sp. JEL0728]|nr:hypothetical protein HDV01_003096 [Terramyces sp. JEL0728]
MFLGILIGQALAQQTSLFEGFTFIVSGDSYTMTNLLNSDVYFKSENVSLNACMNDCSHTDACTVFTHNGVTCWMYQRRLDSYTFTASKGYTTGFFQSRNPGCNDNKGLVTCDPLPNNSGLTKGGNSKSSFQGFKMNINDGLYSSTGSRLKTFARPQSMTRNVIAANTDRTAYVYDINAKFCYYYDLSLQNLRMVTNSSTNCGFFLAKSQVCYDDGTTVQCSVSSNVTSSGTPSASPASVSPGTSSPNIAAIVGIVIAVAIALLVIAFFVFRYYKKKPDQFSSKSPATTLNTVTFGSPNSSHPGYLAVSQKEGYEQYQSVPQITHLGNQTYQQGQVIQTQGYQQNTVPFVNGSQVGYQSGSLVGYQTVQSGQFQTGYQGTPQVNGTIHSSRYSYGNQTMSLNLQPSPTLQNSPQDYQYFPDYHLNSDQKIVVIPERLSTLSQIITPITPIEQPPLIGKQIKHNSTMSELPILNNREADGISRQNEVLPPTIKSDTFIKPELLRQTQNLQ